MIILQDFILYVIVFFFFFFFLHAKDLFASQSCSQNQTGTINLSFSKELRLREIS